MSVVKQGLSCPVCGSKAVLLDMFDNAGVRRFFVYCLNVEHCGLGTDFCTSPEEALSHWKQQSVYADTLRRERRDKA